MVPEVDLRRPWTLPAPHTDTIFSLIPMDDDSLEVANHSANNRHKCKIADNEPALCIGFDKASKDPHTVIDIGRSKASCGIVLNKTGKTELVSRIHCSFRFNPVSKVITLQDKSENKSTHISGDGITMFEPGRTVRCVALFPGANAMLQVGTFTFRLQWHQAFESATQQIRRLETAPMTARLQAQLSATRPDPRTVEASRVETRIQVPKSSHLGFRVRRLNKLSSGGFGTVYRGIDMDSGNLVAEKVIQYGPNQWAMIKAELEITHKLQHEHIIPILNYDQHLDRVSIFMPLQQGSLFDLVKRSTRAADFHLYIDPLFQQIALALDHTAKMGYAHLDVKPANILYSFSADGTYHFYLADFGLSRNRQKRCHLAGTPVYMAPEMLGGTNGQPCFVDAKADIWSFFVTILWVLLPDTHETLRRIDLVHQTRPLHEFIFVAQKFHRWVNEAAETMSCFLPIKNMAAIDPAARVSAADIIAKFSRHGLLLPGLEKLVTLDTRKRTTRQADVATEALEFSVSRQVLDIPSQAPTMADVDAAIPREVHRMAQGSSYVADPVDPGLANAETATRTVRRNPWRSTRDPRP